MSDQLLGLYRDVELDLPRSRAKPREVIGFLRIPIELQYQREGEIVLTQHVFLQHAVRVQAVAA